MHGECFIKCNFAHLAMVFMGQMVATLVMLPVGGTLADRLPRVPLIVTVEVIVGAVVAGQALLIGAGHVRVAELAALAAAMYVAEAFASPARFGLVPALVPAHQLPQANALSKLGHYGILMSGPAAGGLVVATAGPAVGIGLNAASFVLSALLIAGIRASPPPRKQSPFRSDLAAGWRLVTRTPWIGWSIAAGAVLVPCWHVAYGIVGITYVQQHLGGPAAWGLVASALGLGNVAGSLVALVWTPRRGGYVNCLGVAPMALPSICMAAAAPLSVIVAAVAAAAAGLAFAAVTWRSLIQQHVPEHQHGRVSAWVNVGEISLTPVAYLAVGPIVGAFGLRGTLLICGIGILGSALVPLAHPAVRALILISPTTAEPINMNQSDGDPLAL